MEEKPSEREIVFLLHSVLYALENAAGSLGKSVFIYTAKYLPKIWGKFGFSIDKSKSIEENVKSVLNLLEKTEYLENTEFHKIDEESYELKIGKCKLAEYEVHDVLKPEKVFCPYAIAVASIIRDLLDREVVLSESELTKEGSVTVIRTYRYVLTNID